MENNKDTKIVINIGWEAVRSSLMNNFSAYAEKGYILCEMDDRQFIFRKDEPRSVDFFLYTESTDKKGSEYDSLIESGWSELCRYGEFHMMTAPKGTPLPENKKTALEKKVPYIIAAVICAVLLCIAILVIPDINGVLKVLQTILIAISAGGMVFCLTNIFPGKKNGDGNDKGE